MTSLYERGYRQGMSLPTELSVPAANWNGHDLLWEQVASQLWLIATQDCDLDHFADASSDLVELRPVEVTDVRGPSGIRSRYFALPDRGRLDGLSLRPLLPAAFIATLPQGPKLSEQRLLALKLWLGRRYDRPAVPPELVPLMRAIAECLARGADRRTALAAARDVFVDIDEEANPPRYALTAVCDELAAPAVERVMLEAAMEIPQELGVLTDAVAVGVERASIAILERTYVADLSDVSITGAGIRGLPPI